MSVIEALKWRSAIKKFDTNRKVNEEDLDRLKEAANLAATSGGLQPFKLVVVEQKELQQQMVPLSYGQAQVADASQVLVFAVQTDIDEGLVDAYIERAAEVRGVEKEGLIGYADSMKAYISSMDDKAKYTWARNQAYIALGTVLTAAADLKIDTCPMEGFDAQQYADILGLKEHNLMPVVILPIGYRSDQDVHSKEKKVRKKVADFVLTVN